MPVQPPEAEKSNPMDFAKYSPVAMVLFLLGGFGGGGAMATSLGGPSKADIELIVDSVVRETVREEFERERLAREEIEVLRRKANNERIEALEERVKKLEGG